MYLAVDIGGTKTLIGVFTNKGELKQKVRFETPKTYDGFLSLLRRFTAPFLHDDLRAASVAAPGRVDYENGVVLGYGNLDWKNTPLQKDVEHIIDAPVILENDARLAGLSEARLIINDFKRVVYITISTGIGYALIIDGVIDHSIGQTGGKSIMIERNGKAVEWESFASGKAIVKRYGKQAKEITDPKIWKVLAHDFSVGIINLIAMMEPEVIIIGGGVGAHFDRFGKLLGRELKNYELPIVPIPQLRKAKRPEEAVLYGCFELAKERYGSH